MSRHLVAGMKHSGTSSEVEKLSIQTNLSIGSPDGQLEHEADDIAGTIMRMPEQNFIQRKCSHCEEQEKVQRKPLASFIQRKESSTGAVASDAVSNKINASKGNGGSMDSNTQTFMESRFGADFTDIKIHTGGEAIQMNRELNAKAFTVGNDIFFNDGQYNPNSNEGKHLLAHELTHTIQQSKGIQRNVIRRYTGCTTAQDTIITDDHNRARTMLSNAITAVSSYNGTTPSKVFNALNRHFNGSTSNAFATWINVNLRFLWTTTWMAGYNCFTGGSVESTWACRGSEYATTFWCVPLVNIRICPSIYFAMSPVDRSTGLIHEWIHKYGCNLDRGYEFQDEYAQNSTFEQLINAESFAHFIRDVQ